jgi:hypothetical protein
LTTPHPNQSPNRCTSYRRQANTSTQFDRRFTIPHTFSGAYI